MNQREIGRVSTFQLPSYSETDLKKVIKLLNSVIETLNIRDSDKEKRIRELEEQIKRGTGKYSKEKYIGTHFKFVEESSVKMSLYYSPDGVTFDAEPLDTYNIGD